MSLSLSGVYLDWRKRIQPIHFLMIYSHCRVAAREATIVAIIARIGHVSNLTKHTYRSDSLKKKTTTKKKKKKKEKKKTVLSHAVRTLNRVDSSHQENSASLRHCIAYM